MKSVYLKRSIRKWHRYLGLFIGIQFLLWTLGGLYFSWTKIEQIRGDNFKLSHLSLQLDSAIISPAAALAALPFSTARILHCELIRLPHGLVYQIVRGMPPQQQVYLVEATSGKWRPPINREEAIFLAREKTSAQAPVQQVSYLSTTGKHHEYRNKPLPAWAVQLGGEVNSTVYISAEWGTVQSFRNNSWRIFDFLWMLHTMDYEERDNFNNWLLRFFSLMGLLTVISGFALFFVSRKPADGRKAYLSSKN